MPYRIKARSQRGQTVTMMDLDATHPAVNDRARAQQLAEEFARTRSHGGGGEWSPIVEYYEKSIANPLWDRNGAVQNPYDRRS
jgi:Mrp family chromosome partitioning ATPase